MNLCVPWFLYLAAGAQEELEKAQAAHAQSLEEARRATQLAEQHTAQAKTRAAEACQAQVVFLESMVK